MPIQKKFHKISWTRRMIIALIVATVMPAVIISSIIFNVAAKNLEKQAYELTDYKITQRVRFLELDLRQVFDLIYKYSSVSDKSLNSIKPSNLDILLEKANLMILESITFRYSSN